MEKETLKSILLNYINSQENWISKGELGVITEKAGYLPESCGRHLRSMAGGETKKYPNHKPEILVSYYKGKRNQLLSRYARLDTPKAVKPHKFDPDENGNCYKCGVDQFYTEIKHLPTIEIMNGVGTYQNITVELFCYKP